MALTIVCGVDVDDEAAREPLRLAADLAERLDRRLVVGYVAPTHATAAGPGPDAAVAATPALGYPYPIAPDPADVEKVRDESRARVERLIEQHGVADAEVEVQVALDASVADGLRRMALDHDAELLVVGSRGRGTVRAALLGSTSHALATEAPCPVVVIPCSG